MFAVSSSRYNNFENLCRFRRTVEVDLSVSIWEEGFFGGFLKVVALIVPYSCGIGEGSEQPPLPLEIENCSSMLL